MNVRIVATIDAVMEPEELKRFVEEARSSDWAAVTLIDLGGDGLRVSGGFNNLEIERS